MSQYSISDLEKLSGIKAHTIRIWELRYGLISPNRTQTNIRYYSDDNLRDILNIALLNKQGLKISKIANMSRDAISKSVTELTEGSPNSSTHIDALTMAMVNMDELGAEAVLTKFMHDQGFENTMAKLIYPFLDKLNVLWLTGSIQPAHERFISSLIKRKIILAIEQHSKPIAKDQPAFVLFLREGETHELTLLFMHYLLRSRGFLVINLGVNVTLADISTACQYAKPQYVFSIFNEPMHRQSIQSYLDSMAKSINGCKILITGQQVFSQHLKLSKQFQILNGLDDAILLLEDLADPS
jgi:MerR family transcriptional regulator, light-induced transcriptional regulator